MVLDVLFTKSIEFLHIKVFYSSLNPLLFKDPPQGYLKMGFKLKTFLFLHSMYDSLHENVLMIMMSCF